MDWTEVLVEVPQSQAELAESICTIAAKGGIYIEDYADLEQGVEEIAHIDLIDEDLLAKGRDQVIIHLYVSPDDAPAEYLSFLNERFAAAGISPAIATKSLRQEDWANTWKQYYHPMRVGERLVICPSWEETTLAPHEVQLTLDPGMAFGTGSHETTRMCLELMQAFDLKGKRVLDVGCGSGILAISARLLGAKEAVGCDIDPLAVRTANENAARNGVQDGCRFVQGSLTEQITGQYDVIFANIVADVVKLLLPDVPRFLTPGGVLIASGIIEQRGQEVLECAKANGLCLLKTQELRGWVAFAASPNQTA